MQNIGTLLWRHNPAENVSSANSHSYCDIRVRYFCRCRPNGDGLLDIVISDTSDHYAGVLLQNPTHPGTFLGAKYIGPIQSEPLIADMNRDGISDLVLFPATLDNTASAE